MVYGLRTDCKFWKRKRRMRRSTSWAQMENKGKISPKITQ
jgi:hypothetical protein